MKKKIKVLLFFIAFVFISSTIFVSSVGLALVLPAVEGTGLNYTDFFKKNVDPAKIERLEQNILERSVELRSKINKIIIGELERILF